MLPPSGDVRLAAFGDSITQADGDVPAGELGPGSWLSTAVTDGVVFAGGWARGGATTADMLAAAGPVDADVVVVLAGTNDPGADITAAETAANIRALVDLVGVEQVVLSAVPPRDEAPEIAVATNEALAGLASESGWHFADPMAGVRDGDRFAPGMSTDGLHPSEEGAAVIGAALRTAVLEAAGR
ncbi:SGNH/GDSL hydrolase family protein [Geodermatophilus poikilotrophus]|uniref:SGNH/GDSL hydrolase family protein n=1 Tax=Geodermatophilus poikilotrophus TaxID=1333667 RepID=UPI0015873FF6|nr:SGNH/GDSL hydrolase family protein [Geodermatophilus poikilotrophus]